MKITDQDLARWCANQRSAYSEQIKTGRPRLSAIHIKQLEAIPGWKWNMNDAAFEKGVEEYKKYGNQPYEFTTPDGYNLGTWISSARHNTKDPERRKILESLPGWEWNKREARWMTRWQESMKIGVVAAKSQEHPALGAWQGQQRTKTGQSKLTKKQRELLEQIPGWVWDASFRVAENTQAMMKEKSEKTFAVGIKYTKKYGPVSQKFVTPDGYRLGLWQSNQRSRCKDPKQRKALEAIPGWKWQLRKSKKRK